MVNSLSHWPRKVEGEKKKKKLLLDTSHVDRVTGAQSTPSELAKPSPAKSSAKKARSNEEGVVTLTFSIDESVYFDPTFMWLAVESLLLPADHKRLIDIDPM